MSSADDPCEIARQEMLRLLRQDDWKFCDTARQQGLEQYGQRFRTECAMIDYIYRLLRQGFQLNAVPLGNPPGSGGEGWSMNNTDGQGLYVKLKMEAGFVWVLSFHRSVHFRGEGT